MDDCTSSKSCKVLHRAPRLSGWLLRLAVWILESVLGAVILTRMWRRSGIQQVLRETEVPEEATYQPAWPHPDATSAGVDIEVLDVPRRATVAAHTIPGRSLQIQHAQICRMHVQVGRVHSLGREYT